ncbi:MAG: hypothetical protein LBO20_00215 [Bifidobacteriaceae bacterium]|nr:hypothetical protein [Bifidobacteriaceae bacterium]
MTAEEAATEGADVDPEQAGTAVAARSPSPAMLNTQATHRHPRTTHQPSSRAQFEDLAVQRRDAASGVRLLIGNQDLTDSWVRCSGQTGYSRPVYAEDPKDELADKQRAADAGAAWASCARRHGYPTAKDPAPPVADGWQTQPTAVLPATITVAELKALLEECPSFDREAWREADRALAENPELSDEEYLAIKGADPAIRFDVPCADGSAVKCDEATWARLNPLTQVIEQQVNDYLREVNQGGGR